MRPARFLAFGLWVSLAPALLASVLSPASSAAAPRVKKARHVGAFSISVPASGKRTALTVTFDPSSRLLSVGVPGSDMAPVRALQLPELTSTQVRSELLQLTGGEPALVLYFGEPKPYVVVLMAPLQTALAADAGGAPSDFGAVLTASVLLKGFLAGADGQEASLSITDGPDGSRLILSEAAPNASILCGRGERTSRALDPVRGRFTRVALPLLGAEERRLAKKLRAKGDAGGGRDVYLGALPSPFETEAFAAAPLMDGSRKVQPFPYESNQVLLPPGAGALAIEVADPHAPDAAWDLWLWSDKGVFEVDTSDVRGAPRFVVDLPEELRAGCLALSVGARPTFVEVSGRLPPDALALAPPERALMGPQAELAARELAGRTEEVVPELARSYASLPAEARAHGESLARLAAPRDAEPFWVRQLLDGNEGEATRAELRLQRLEDGGRGALGRALRAATPKDELPLAHALAELSAAAALRPIATRLAQRSAARRLELRKVLAELSADREFVREVEALLRDGAVDRRQKVEVLRAVAPVTPSLSPEVRKQVLLLLESASFAEAYVLVPVALELSSSEKAAERILLDWAGGKRQETSSLERAALRTEILSAARDQERSSKALSRLATELLADPYVRVRVGATGYLALAPDSSGSSALEERLRHDDWPVVREEALGALASLRADPKLGEAVDAAMIRALGKDQAPSVRGRAARELDELSRPGSIEALRRSLGRDESAAVRAEAARALGLLCDEGALALLTSAARGLTRGARDEADVRLGLNAVTALARLEPVDLDARLAPLTAKSVPGPLRARVESAIESGRGGCASAKDQ